MRDELLDTEVSANVAEAQVLTGDYREHYNHRRPHGALSYMSPAEFAAAEAQRGQDPDPAVQLQSVSGLPL